MSMSKTKEAPKATKLLKNPGIELDVSNVGRRLNYLEDARKGETIQFTYNGGSDVGGVRTVLVQAVDSANESIGGMTLERDGEYRSYLDKNNKGEIRVVAPFVENFVPAPEVPKATGLVENRVRFDQAKTALLAVLTAEQLAELYHQHVAKDSKGVSYDAVKGELVVKTEPPKPVINVIGNKDNSHQFSIKGPGGELKFYVHHSEKNVGLDFIPTGSSTYSFGQRKVTPAQIAEYMNKVLA